jgi:hypothetical protein
LAPALLKSWSDREIEVNLSVKTSWPVPTALNVVSES